MFLNDLKILISGDQVTGNVSGYTIVITVHTFVHVHVYIYTVHVHVLYMYIVCLKVSAQLLIITTVILPNCAKHVYTVTNYFLTEAENNVCVQQWLMVGNS